MAITFDSRGLRFLNRRERNFTKGNDRGVPTMKIDLTKEVHAVTADKKPIKDESGNAPSLRDVIVTCLRTTPQNTPGREKESRGLLARRIEKIEKEIEVTTKETMMIQDAVRDTVIHPDLIVAVFEALVDKSE